jgi:superfamily I DNA/RNA helicase
MGIFFVKTSNIPEYLFRLNGVVQLRYNKKEHRTVSGIEVMNFGISKGLEFNHIFIYPTTPMLEWLINNKSKLALSSRAELYVALTRAFYSIGIAVDDNFNKTVEGITIWRAESS